jgi:rhodanese-related sulfurtransferase
MFESLFRKKGYKNISSREAKERIDTDNNVILLDVRTPEEFREEHIPKSISLPLNKLKTGISKVASNKDTEIIVYCLSGMRAATASNQLADMGYTNVSNMGGIQSWKYETESGDR